MILTVAIGGGAKLMTVLYDMTYTITPAPAIHILESGVVILASTSAVLVRKRMYQT